MLELAQLEGRQLPLLDRIQEPMFHRSWQKTPKEALPQKARNHKRPHNRQNRLSQQYSPKSKMPGVSDSNPLSPNSEEERSLELRPTQTFSENSIENLSLPMKRKSQPLESSVPKLIRQKLEPSDTLPYPKQEQKPTLLSRIDVEMNNPERTLSLRTTKADQRKSLDCTNRICLGTHTVSSTKPVSVPLLRRLSSFSESTIGISKNASSLLASHQELPTTSLPLNGNISSKANQSISTRSCLLSTGLQLLRTGRHELEKQKYLLDRLKLQERFRPRPTGLPHGDELQERLHTRSLTEPKNLKITPSTLKTSSPLKARRATTGSSYTISQSETLSAEDNNFCLPTSTDSFPCTQQSSCQTGSNTEINEDRHAKEKSYATDSMTKGVKRRIVVTDTPVRHAVALPTENQTATLPPGIEVIGKRPKYLRYHIWDPDGAVADTTAEWTERAKPLPRPTSVQLMHPVVRETIIQNPTLFEIVTPIKLKVFEDLLKGHPNQNFVKSVCEGLRYGFWPWADIWKPGYPDELDLSRPQASKASEEFLITQRDHEVQKRRYSPSIGPDLLPGMYCMPIYAVPKPHSEKLRLVNDHSASKFSLNSMVEHNQVIGYPMDSLAQFGERLVNLRKEQPDLQKSDSIVVWKSDISEAYRICPLHPFWQLKQGVRIGNDVHVDRCIVFGSSASPAIFIAFNSLVTWIAKHVRQVSFITTYLDDSSGCTWKDDISYYAPYNKYMPSPQVRLLTLWDDLGIPHEERKQIYGPSIPVIGIQVDPNLMCYTLPEESKLQLQDELAEWISWKGKRNVRTWQHLAGWINWCLNVFPLLRPSLSNVYEKLRSQPNQNGSIWVNNAVREDLTWALNKVKTSPGLLLLETSSWTLEAATFTIYCDACPAGLGFWYPDLNLGFVAETPTDEVSHLIFYFEALCVLCALHDACNRASVLGRFVIYTDNTNTVDIFSSLHAKPEYNILLRQAVDLLTTGKHDLRVLHVPGEQNQVADALSRGQFERAIQLQPLLEGQITLFEPYRRVRTGTVQGAVYSLSPPRDTLGAFRK
jgi:hypothetical protein